MPYIRSLLLGFAIGSAISALVIVLFMPKTAAEMRRIMSESFQEVKEEAKQASIAKRLELEAELAEMRHG